MHVVTLTPPNQPPASQWRAEGQVAAHCAADIRRHALTLPEHSGLRADLLEAADCWTLLAGMRGVTTIALAGEGI